MKIVHKLFVAPAFAMCFLLVIGGLSINAMGNQGQRLQTLKNSTFEGFRVSSTQTIALGQINSEIYANMAIMASLDDAGIQKLTSKVKQQVQSIKFEFEKVKDNPSVKPMIAEILPILERYQNAVLKAIDLASMDPNTGVASMQSATKEFQSLRAKLDESLKRLESETTAAIIASDSANLAMIWVIGCCLAIALLTQIMASILVSRSVTVPLNQAVEIAQTVASGNLDLHIEVSSKDEIGQLLRALKEMSDSLASVVGKVRLGSDTIAIASNQIAAGNLDLSDRTESQTKALKETTNSMQGLTSTVQRNDEHALQASSLAREAADTAVKGGEVVANVITSMGNINSSSKRIADIIGVIDGIAFQTNILALNAAVEAARAGEQGRGFAVVASEVRSLAQRSASAAKEISQLIRESESQVSLGSNLVDQAGQTMRVVVESIQRVNSIMSEITTDSHEQADRIAIVNDAVVHMEKTTQQNAALIEEAAAAAESMKDEAKRLVTAISVFSLNKLRS